MANSNAAIVYVFFISPPSPAMPVGQARDERAENSIGGEFCAKLRPLPPRNPGAVRAFPAHVDAPPICRRPPLREPAAMLNSTTAARRALPSIDRLLKLDAVAALVAEHGHPLVVETLRAVIDDRRAKLAKDPAATPVDEDTLTALCTAQLQALARPSLRPVFNLTGTV